MTRCTISLSPMRLPTPAPEIVRLKARGAALRAAILDRRGRFRPGAGIASS